MYGIYAFRMTLFSFQQAIETLSINAVIIYRHGAVVKYY